jgi:tetraacyldisaccharide 4'-kinase
MKLKKPKFWDYKKKNFFSYLMQPFTLPILLNNFFLNNKNKKLSKNIKSICIGNIYVGGTGKTPLVAKLYNLLNKKIKNIVVAKKFYQDQIDEIKLLEKKTNLIHSKSRIDLIDDAIKKNNQIIIFDDGLQDKNIDYNLKFVCFDAMTWIGNGQIIPAGPLRENLNSLKKYHAIFLNNYDENMKDIQDKLVLINPKLKIFKSKYFIKNIDRLDKESKYLIFSGIGNPQNFKKILENSNFKIVNEIKFPDHYNYLKSDLEKIIDIAIKNNLKILTTEKDYVKIPNNFKSKIGYVEIDLDLLNETEIINYIENKLNE